MWLKELTSKFIDIKIITTVILTLLAAFSWVASSAEGFLEEIKDDLYVSMTDPFYGSMKYDLMKQLEKLNNDPSDIKSQDIDKFAEYCDGYFGTTYIITQPDARALKLACDGMLTLYDNKLYQP